MKYRIEKMTGTPQSVAQILRENGISSRMLKKIRQGAGQILYNGQVIKQQQSIQGPAVLTVDFHPEQADPRVEQSLLPIEILAEDQLFLALNKDAHTSSVPGPTNSTTTLSNRALGYGQQHVPQFVPHILTRLDYDTSGIVLFAKSNFVQSLVQDQIAQHTMKKEYLAVVSGHLPEKHAMIDLPLRKENFKSARRIVSKDGKPAQTEYWVQKYLPNATVVKVRLHTGRTHQIRAHFAYLGFPLVGDELYGGPTNFIQRQLLHAARLELTNPFTHQPQIFNAPIPKDFRQALERLH